MPIVEKSHMKKVPAKIYAKKKPPPSISTNRKYHPHYYLQLEKKVASLKKIIAFLSEINQAIIRVSDEKTLYKEICNIAIQVGKFRMIWVGLLDKESKIIQPIIHAGYEKGYLTKITAITVKNAPEGRGPTGEALRKGKHVICNDIENDPRMILWKKEALERGYHSSIALPIKKSKKIIGAISIYSGEKNFFNKDEVRLLHDAAADISFALDVMENTAIKKKTEEEVKFLYEIYEKVSQATSDTIWDWDIRKKTVHYSKGISEVYGYPVSNIPTTLNWWENNVHQDDLGKVKTALINCFQNKEHTFSLEYRFKCADNTYKYVFDRAFIVYNKKKPVRMVGAMQDITFLREEELRMAKAIISAQEAERHYIGQELHDNVNQILVASLLNLEILKRFKKEKAPELIDTIKGYLSTAIHEIRNLSHQLSPSTFGDVTLNDIFESLLESINADKKYKITLNFVYPLDNHIKNDLQITLYRILQEATSNIVKYAKADSISVYLKKNENYILLRITDNGVGFNPVTTKNGFGLNNIKKRVESFGGTFKLSSAPNNGCEIEVMLPHDE